MRGGAERYKFVWERMRGWERRWRPGEAVGEGVPGLGHIAVPLQGEERGVDPQALGQAVGVSGVDLFRKE